MNELSLDAQAGGSREFAQVYERYADRLYRYALARTGSEMAADDIVSDTSNWEHLGQLPMGSPFTHANIVATPNAEPTNIALYLFSGTVEVDPDAEPLPTPTPEPTAHERLFAVSHIRSIEGDAASQKENSRLATRRLSGMCRLVTRHRCTFEVLVESESSERFIVGCMPVLACCEGKIRSRMRSLTDAG